MHLVHRAITRSSRTRAYACTSCHRNHVAFVFLVSSLLYRLFFYFSSSRLSLVSLSRYLRSRDTRVRKSTRPWPHATLRRGTRKSREPYSERDRHRVRVTASIIRGEPRFSRDIGVDEALSVPFATFLVSSSRGSGAVYGFIIRARLEKAARFHGDDAKVSATSR